MLYVLYTLTPIMRGEQYEGIHSEHPRRANTALLQSAESSECNTSLAFWLGIDAEGM